MQMMNKLIDQLLRRKAIVFILIVLWGFFGAYSYYAIPKQENPDSSVPGAIITTIYPGANSKEVENMVTQKIEDAVYEVGSIDSLESISMNSASIVVVLFNVEAKADEVLPILRQNVSDIQKDLPEMAFESEINTELAKTPQFIISLSGNDYTQEDLVSYGIEIKKAILSVDGVSSVDIEGELNKQVNVTVDIDALDLYDISIENISDLLQAQNLSIPSGSIKYETGIVNVNTPSTFSSLHDIENIVLGGSSEDLIGFIYLKDIADVSIGYEDGYSFMQDGKSAILLSGYFDDGVNGVLIGEDVREVIDEMKKQLPPNLEFHEVVYSPEDIDESVTDFIQNLIESIGLIVIVVMIGVRLKNAIVVSLSLPLSIFATFIVMYLVGIEFHFISITALIISLGILVDNAIVVSDAIQQKINEDYSIKESIHLAVSETAAPVFTSTLTTIVTFGILLFVPGTTGEVVRTIPIVVITSLVASYVVAMFIIPLFASISFTKEDNKKLEAKPSRIRESFNSLLKLGLTYKKSTIAIAFSTLIIAAFLVLSLGITFFPYSDKPIIYINIKGETLNLDETQRIVDEVHDILAEEELIKHYTTSIGTGLPRFFLTIPAIPAADNTAQIMIELDNEHESYEGNSEIGYRIQQRVNEEIVGAKIDVKYLEISMPVDAKITIEITGEDLSDLKELSEQSQEILRNIDGTTNVRDDYVNNAYEYSVEIDSDIVSLMGILKYDVVKQINTSLMGAETSNYIVGGNEIPIVVKGNIESLDDLYRLPISSSVTETQILLHQIADVELATYIPTINRINKERSITIMSDLEPGASSLAIESEFKELVQIPSGVSIRFNGEMTQMMALLSTLGIAAVIAVVLIYIILLFQFEQYTKPLIILMSIPLSFIGSFLGLYMFNMDLQAMALLGLVSLIGIVVNNGIILVEVMDALILEGMSVNDACINAVDKRYRAITLSTITTCIGLVPLILSGDPMSAPMASVLLFGLLLSTILTMVIVPVMYSMIMIEQDDITTFRRKALISYANELDLNVKKHTPKRKLIKLIQVKLNENEKVDEEG
jgi:multidrug efflux pump subunit AcrB